ncbi:MAG: hypothetical protein VYD87_07260 [Pseudomonadota bacterium]|nr:hypothetical protein [Pseudomonadota bacterium]
MKRETIIGRLSRICLICGLSAGAGLAATDPARAIAVGVNASSYTISHDSGFGPTGGLGPKAIPAWPPVIEYNQTLTDGTNTSQGAGGGATLVRPDLVGLGFPAGTGVSQDWIAGAHDEAVLRIDFDVTYDVAGGFGPPTWSFANFGLIGQVSDGGWVHFEYAAVFTGVPGGVLGGALSGSYTNATPGAFAVGLSEFHFNGAGVPDVGVINLTGYIQFEAFDGFNHDSSSILLGETSGVMPAPLPAAAPLLAGAMGLLILARRRARRREDGDGDAAGS